MAVTLDDRVRGARWLVMPVLMVACGGPQAASVVCGEGTTQRGGQCVAVATSTTVKLETSPEAEVDAAAVADFAARMCECRDPTCALDVSRQLSEWNRQREVTPTPALQQSTRVYLACVAKISATSVATTPAPTPVKPPVADVDEPPPSMDSVTAEEFRVEFQKVSALVAKLEAMDSARAAEPRRLLAAVQTNYAFAIKDAEVRERLMRMLGKVRAATEKRLER